MSNKVMTRTGVIDEWAPMAIDSASKALTLYLRHGAKDDRMNFIFSDGYSPASVLLQLPLCTANRITKEVIEMALRIPRPRIMMDD